MHYYVEGNGFLSKIRELPEFKNKFGDSESREKKLHNLSSILQAVPGLNGQTLNMNLEPQNKQNFFLEVCSQTLHSRDIDL